jgi:Domain of unknown function (DUF5667)
MNRPARADEELDVVLDGHRHLFTSELGPAVEAARMLGAELRSIQIAPEVAERHIAMALARARHAAVRARWRSIRRTAVAMAAAAALVVGPAALAAGAALPGEPLYPIKRTIEAADLAFAFSPASDARAHTRIAAARLSELHALVAKGRSKQVPDAVMALKEAMSDADAAIARAIRTEGPGGETATVAGRLAQVRENMIGEISVILARGEELNLTAEQQDQLREAFPPPTTTPAPAADVTAPAGPPVSATTGATDPPPTTSGGATTSTPPTTEPPPTTQPPTTVPPTTEAPPPGSSEDQPPADPTPEDTP